MEKNVLTLFIHQQNMRVIFNKGIEGHYKKIIRNFHKHLRQEAGGRKIEVRFNGVCAVVEIEWSGEELFYNGDYFKFCYLGEAPGFDVGGNQTEFILDDDHVKLINEKLKETMKIVAKNRKGTMFCFAHRNRPPKVVR